MNLMNFYFLVTKPKNLKLLIGRPDNCNADIIDDGPGIV